jgi:MoaE-MoaD fusion protein
MQKLNVLYFAHVREVVGRAAEIIEVPAGADVASVLQLLCSNYPRLGPVLARCRVALNDAFVTPDAVTADGDEIVLIPPVAGGSGMGPGATVGALPAVWIGPETLDGQVENALRRLVASSGHGAVVTFVGQVRDHARGRNIVSLEYEAHVSMARKQLQSIVVEVETAHPGVVAAVHHRVGLLGIGDIAVIVAVASAHRQAAFAACQMVIDRLKQDVPIWKRETGPDGAVWIDDRP